MDSTTESPGGNNQPGSLFSSFMAEAESIANMSYDPSGSETQYSASLMGAMMSTSDLCLPLSTHATDGDDEKTLASGTLKSIPASINNQVFHEDSSNCHQQAHGSINISAKTTRYDENDIDGHSKEIKPLYHPTTSPANTHINNNKTISWTTPQDPENPRNWSSPRKALITLTTSAILLGTVSLPSSIFIQLPLPTTTSSYLSNPSTPTTPITHLNLPSSLYLLGLALGTPFTTPSSHGHRSPLFISLAGLCACQIPTALSTSLPVLLICRFLSGVFSSGVVAIIPCVYEALYEPVIAAPVAMAVSGCCALLGAVVGPVVGGYLSVADEGTGWRWTSWSVLIIGVVLWLVGVVFTVPETCQDVLLRRRARRLRGETGDWALHAACEEVLLPPRVRVKIWSRMWRGWFGEGLVRPVRMVFTEPVLFFITVHVSMIYGVLYLALVVVPWGFWQRGEGMWDVGTVATLPVVGVALGVVTGGGLFCLVTATWYKRRSRYRPGGIGSPEDSLPTMLLGAVILPLALLWFGWSISIHWASQAVAGYFIGFGLTLVSVSGTGYLYDAYGIHARSAMSARVVIQNLVGSSILLGAVPFVTGLDVRWASSVMALVCAIMVPIPIVFMVYGVRIRSRSEFSFLPR